jgi:hypothetical protein
MKLLLIAAFVFSANAAPSLLKFKILTHCNHAPATDCTNYATYTLLDEVYQCTVSPTNPSACTTGQKLAGQVDLPTIAPRQARSNCKSDTEGRVDATECANRMVKTFHRGIYAKCEVQGSQCTATELVYSQALPALTQAGLPSKTFKVVYATCGFVRDGDCNSYGAYDGAETVVQCQADPARAGKCVNGSAVAFANAFPTIALLEPAVVLCQAPAETSITAQVCSKRVVRTVDEGLYRQCTLRRGDNGAPDSCVAAQGIVRAQ